MLKQERQEAYREEKILDNGTHWRLLMGTKIKIIPFLLTVGRLW